MKKYLILLVLVSYSLAATLELFATVRDFTPDTSADFEFNPPIGFIPGLVLPHLDSDFKPVRSSLAAPGTNDLSKWYRHTYGVNFEVPINITLDDSGNPGLFACAISSFFPIDNQGFGNFQNTNHNFHFTTEIVATFVFNASINGTITFTGNDDVWIFINGDLVLDLGGVHASLNATVNVNSLNLTDGETCEFRMFHAQRHTFASNFNLQTNLVLMSNATTPPQQTIVDLCGVTYLTNCSQHDSNCSARTPPAFNSLPAPDIQTPFLQFNAIVFGNFAVHTGDTGGRLGCGGNFTTPSGGYSVGAQVVTTGANKILDPSTFSLIIEGNMDWKGDGSVEPLGPGFTPGYANPSQRETTALGGLKISAPAGVSVTPVSASGLSNDFMNGKNYYMLVQNDLASMPSNAMASQGGQLDCHVACNNGSETSYVIDVDGSLISKITSYTFSNCNPNAQYIFNVGGNGTVSFNGDNIHLPDESIPVVKVIWNILGSGRNISVNTAVFGHILAPEHHIQQTGGNIIGRVICDSFSASGASQISQPVCPTPPVITPPPSPICPFFENDLKCTLDLSEGDMIVSFKDYAVVSFGDFTANTGDIQGRLIVGGDLMLGNGFSIGDQINTSPSGHDNPVNYALIVAGNAHWGSGALFPDVPPAPAQGNQEGIYVGGNFTAPSYLLERQTPAFHLTHLQSDLANARNCYTKIQNYFANLTVNAHAKVQFLGLHVTCDKPTASRYVLDVDASLINMITWYSTSNCNFGAEYIINVGGNGTVNFGGNSFPAIAGGVTYNILGSNRTINVNTQVNGNILAPWNILNQHGGVVVGKVVVASVKFALQINVPQCPHNIIPVTIPLVCSGPAPKGQPIIPCHPGLDNVKPGDVCNIEGDIYIIAEVFIDHFTVVGNCENDYSAGAIIIVTVADPLVPRGPPAPPIVSTGSTLDASFFVFAGTLALFLVLNA